MDKTKLISYSEFKKKALKDPEVSRAYDDLKTEYAIITQVIGKRLRAGMTQKQLAQKIGTKQSAISRLESGSSNPSINFLEKIAKALGSKVSVSLS